MSLPAKKRWIFLILVVPLLASIGFAGYWVLTYEKPPENSISIKQPIKGAHDQLFLQKQDDGSFQYIVMEDTGHKDKITPEQFAARIYDEQHGRTWLLKVCNVTSYIGLAWIAVGLIGQVMFTGRMIVQWLVTEKNKRSVVPVSFWWLSLIGSSMLLVYFIWRVDPIGILGQLFGWGVYLRNLYAIYTAEDEVEEVGEKKGQGSGV